MLKGLEGSQLAITNSRKFIAPAGYYFLVSLQTSDRGTSTGLSASPVRRNTRECFVLPGEKEETF